MDTPRSTVDWILEAVTGVALLVAIVDLALHWHMLPERIPTHFGASGEPNGWGGRGMLLVLLATTVGTVVMLTVAAKYQRLINIPMNVDRELPEVRRLLRSMIITLKAAITLMFVWVSHVTMQTALGETHGLGAVFLPVFLCGIFAPLIYYLVKLNRL